MHIAMIASEAVPFVKTGGLADVLGALPKALARLGHHITIVLPYYHRIRSDHFNIKTTKKKARVHIDGKERDAEIFRVNVAKNIDALLLKHDNYFAREELYQTKAGDYPDNAARFGFFAKAALRALEVMGLEVDVLHAHDWQAALALYFARTVFRNSPLARAKTILTIHNIGYQGSFPSQTLTTLGLGVDHFTMARLEFYGRVNFLKGGIIAADAVTTVSPTHALELMTEEMGFGLEGVLAAHRRALSGIVNGIDYDEWNPATDPHIITRYTPADLDGKTACKTALQKRFKLPVKADTPLVGMIGRLTVQKGFDLLCEALPAIEKDRVQIVILGTGELKYHNLLKAAMKEYPDSLRIELAFDNALAHQIEAGADFFLMPSLYEPCGLNQMISQKYGTLPIVRATGGLNDTVQHFDARTWKGNGFKFLNPFPTELTACLVEALEVWAQPVLRNKLIKNAMECDNSWQHAAKEYVALYEDCTHLAVKSKCILWISSARAVTPSKDGSQIARPLKHNVTKASLPVPSAAARKSRRPSHPCARSRHLDHHALRFPRPLRYSPRFGNMWTRTSMTSVPNSRTKRSRFISVTPNSAPFVAPPPRRKNRTFAMKEWRS